MTENEDIEMLHTVLSATEAEDDDDIAMRDECLAALKRLSRERDALREAVGQGGYQPGVWQRLNWELDHRAARIKELEAALERCGQNHRAMTLRDRDCLKAVQRALQGLLERLDFENRGQEWEETLAARAALSQEVQT